MNSKIDLMDEKQSYLRDQLIEIRKNTHLYGLKSDLKLKVHSRAIDELNLSLKILLQTLDFKESEISLKKVNIRKQSEFIAKFDKKNANLSKETSFFEVSLNFQEVSKNRSDKRLVTLDQIQQHAQYLVL